ncbi:MAG: purine-nucleoside phosphorylase [Bacteroidota bacterium]
MPDLTTRLQGAAQAVLKRLPVKPALGLILGSGLGEFAGELSNPIPIPASEIPFYPQSTVEGHSGRVVFGTISENGFDSIPLVVFQGRVHFYETGDLDPVLFPVRLAIQLGITSLIVTNAAGGVNRNFHPGDLMLITGVLNLTFLPLPSNPSGKPSHLGILDPKIREYFQQNARSQGISLREGTYCWLKGPSYETAAEIEMLARTGVDAVGMSTVPELTIATQSGIRTAGLSLISNMGTGIGAAKLSHQEVTETASKVRGRLSRLLRSTIMSMSQPPPV